MKQNPEITRKELSLLIDDISEGGIKYHIRKLKRQGKLKRIGPDKGGRWEVSDESFI